MSTQSDPQSDDRWLPALRPVDVSPFEGEDGEIRFVLYDRSQIAPGSMAVSPAGYFVLAHLDGEHTCADVQRAFLEQTGVRLTEEPIMELVGALDQALLLEGERFERAYERRRAEYLAAPARDNRERYPDGALLRSELERILARGAATSVSDVRGLIAPHLDYARGAPCYADAYATLAKVPRAERYVILGTNHAGRATGAVATNKDFQTPLGLVRTDRTFVSCLEKRLGRSLCTHELDHFHEHSVELQVQFLQVIVPDGGFEIVPVLCPSPRNSDAAAEDDASEPGLRAFAAALADELAEDRRRTVVIAGADLSHVGRHFGDSEQSTPEFLESVAKADRELLRLLEERQEEALVARLLADGNPLRVCGMGCIYALLRALPGRACRIIGYHQAINYKAETHVTCSAAVIW